MNHGEAIRKLQNLHPVARGAFIEFYMAIQDDERLSFVRPFETYRTPEDQDKALSSGNSKVGAWRSVHQYGCACDFVPCPAGRWTWEFRDWEYLHTRALRFGIHAPIKWDKPHLVLMEWRRDIRNWLRDNAFT